MLTTQIFLGFMAQFSSLWKLPLEKHLHQPRRRSQPSEWILEWLSLFVCSLLYDVLHWLVVASWVLSCEILFFEEPCAFGLALQSQPLLSCCCWSCRNLKGILMKMVRNAKKCNYARLLSRHCPLPTYLPAPLPEVKTSKRKVRCPPNNIPSHVPQRPTTAA